ncbi:MAG: hypothetical protein A6F71_09260 [Cycloclasticus sp. symbiont of Poecilosclerida sp. M]|nr:MAG: hypothetical protein A6F71_09260 [Cycloclasticus sp. symbiont of Poecilosclerida sp. M]
MQRGTCSGVEGGVAMQGGTCPGVEGGVVTACRGARVLVWKEVWSLHTGGCAMSMWLLHTEGHNFTHQHASHNVTYIFLSCIIIPMVSIGLSSFCFFL